MKSNGVDPHRALVSLSSRVTVLSSKIRMERKREMRKKFSQIYFFLSCALVYETKPWVLSRIYSRVVVNMYIKFFFAIRRRRFLYTDNDYLLSIFSIGDLLAQKIRDFAVLQNIIVYLLTISIILKSYYAIIYTQMFPRKLYYYENFK